SGVRSDAGRRDVLTAEHPSIDPHEAGEVHSKVDRGCEQIDVCIVRDGTGPVRDIPEEILSVRATLPIPKGAIDPHAGGCRTEIDKAVFPRAEARGTG